MLGIMLMVLKIIGWLLLGILGLFAVLLFLVLFVPVTYRLWVSGDSGDIKALEYRVKIFGIQVVPMKKRKNRKEKRGRKQTKEAVPQIPVDNSGAQQQESDDSQQGVAPPSPSSVKDQQPVKETSQEKQTAAKKEKSSKASGLKGNNTSGRDVRGMLFRIRTEFTDEGNRRALRHVFSEILYLLRHFGPRRVRADLSFSLGDPANTGYATAALSVCPFSYGKDCRILADFEAEQFYLRGWMDVRGHIRLVHALIGGLRLLFDKDIRRIIGKLLKKK